MLGMFQYIPQPPSNRLSQMRGETFLRIMLLGVSHRMNGTKMISKAIL